MKHFYPRVNLLIFACFLGFSVQAMPFEIFLADSPNQADLPFSHYDKKHKMLSFSKYIPRPIPVKCWKDTSLYIHFSDTGSKDRFRLSIVGDYEYTAIVYFQIITEKKFCIYKDSFPLMDLLSIYIDGGGNYGTKLQKERAIESYIEALFDPLNIDKALDQLPESMLPEYTIKDNLHYLANNKAQKFFCYTRKPDSNTFIGLDPVQGYCLKFYETHND
ncbi:MAG: hypothetical protein MH472_05890 [Bacteroidia bacterium]|nr:hypothetical protein [Bacteroidia bacterium]